MVWLACLPFHMASEEPQIVFTIGALAKNTVAKTTSLWKPTFSDFLNNESRRLNLPYRFNFTTFNFDDVMARVSSKELDFMFTNSAQSVEIQKRFGMKALVTLENKRVGKDTTVFGGVILTNRNSGVHTLAECAQSSKIYAVSGNSFGGYLMQKRELLQKTGVLIDDAKVNFTKSHMKVIAAILAGEAQCGFVRTDTLEKNGLTDPSLVLLGQRTDLLARFFPFKLCTDLYGEWPVQHASGLTDQQLLDFVTYSLLSVRAQDAAAVAGGYSRFVTALPYDDVAECLYDVGYLERPQTTNSNTVVIVVLVCFVVLLCVMAVLFFWLRKKGQRDNRRAVTAAPLCVLFTDIEQSTMLWCADATAMADAVSVHHSVIRKVLDQNKGYEVKTVGDSFMITCKEPVQAVAIAIGIQEGLEAAPWSDATQAMCDAVYGSLPTDSTVQDPVHGPRVRIGVTVGLKDTVQCRFDTTVKGYDYYGQAVNLAARLEAAAFGGMIACDGALAKALEHVQDPPFGRQFLAQRRLKGVSGAVDIWQIVPQSLAHRQFPRLREDDPELGEDSDSEGDDDEGVWGGGHFRRRWKTMGLGRSKGLLGRGGPPLQKRPQESGVCHISHAVAKGKR